MFHNKGGEGSLLVVFVLVCNIMWNTRTAKQLSEREMGQGKSPAHRFFICMYLVILYPSVWFGIIIIIKIMDLEKEIESGKTTLFACYPKRIQQSRHVERTHPCQYNYSSVTVIKTTENGTSQYA